MQRKFDDFIMSQVIDKYNDDLIVLGARPAIGKSTFLASLAKILSLDNDIPTVVFCPETVSYTHLTLPTISHV